MSFTDILQRKIDERRTGQSPKVLAEAAREKRIRALATPVLNALEAMCDRCLEDPLFADVVGRPEVSVTPLNDEAGFSATLSLRGRLVTFSVLADLLEDRFNLWINPAISLRQALNCSMGGYSPDCGLKGRSKDLPAFIAAIEDHIADFLADVATTSAAALLLQSSTTAGTGFDTLTQY